ncbi:MAG: hypothetical protein WC536_04620 [Patescibacteria group bacterium]
MTTRQLSKKQEKKYIVQTRDLNITRTTNSHLIAINEIVLEPSPRSKIKMQENRPQDAQISASLGKPLYSKNEVCPT